MQPLSLSNYHILTPPIVHPVPFTLLIFDADGTLRGCAAEGRPPNSYAEATKLPHVDVILHKYAWKRQHYFGIASNQGGVDLGYMTDDVCRGMIRNLGHDASWFIWPDEVLRYCPHAPKAGCACRKPQPQMLRAIELYWHSEGVVHGPTDTLYVGDQESDREAAERAGMAFCWAKDFFAWKS